MKAHSNIDFDLATNFGGFGGLDGLFRVLLKLPAPLHKSETKDENAKEQQQVGLTDDSSKQNKEETGSTITNAKAENAKAEADSSKGGQANTDANDEDDTGKGEVDARDVFRRAKSALALATELHAAAKMYAEAPPRLSNNFIAENFPFDSTDGKYGFCVICGLSGDLLCCDTKGCPNTVHPECANLTEIPEGNWFCGLCPSAEDRGAKVSFESKERGVMEFSPKTKAATNDLLQRDAGLAREGGSKTSAPGDLSEVHDVVATKEVTTQGLKSVQGGDNAQDADVGGSRGLTVSIAKTQSVDVDKTYSVGKIPPIIAFDEQKSAELTAELDQLFFLRTGRRRGWKPDEVSEEKDAKASEEDHANEDGVQKPQIGCKFQKKFGRYGYYTGTVTSLPSEQNEYFRVIYEDGDEEDLSEQELFRLLSNRRSKKLQKMRSAAEGKDPSPEKDVDGANDSKPRKKRGRPRKNDRCTAEEESEDVQKISESVKAGAERGVDAANGGNAKKKRGRPRKGDRSITDDGKDSQTDAESGEAISPDEGKQNQAAGKKKRRRGEEEA